MDVTTAKGVDHTSNTGALFRDTGSDQLLNLQHCREKLREEAASAVDSVPTKLVTSSTHLALTPGSQTTSTLSALPSSTAAKHSFGNFRLQPTVARPNSLASTLLR